MLAGNPAQVFVPFEIQRTSSHIVPRSPCTCGGVNAQLQAHSVDLVGDAGNSVWKFVWIRHDSLSRRVAAIFDRPGIVDVDIFIAEILQFAISPVILEIYCFFLLSDLETRISWQRRGSWTLRCSGHTHSKNSIQAPEVFRCLHPSLMHM